MHLEDMELAFIQAGCGYPLAKHSLLAFQVCLIAIAGRPHQFRRNVVASLKE